MPADVSDASAPIPCCVDVPTGGALVRYGLTELLRGLGLAPVWVRKGDARLVLSAPGHAAAHEGTVALGVSDAALQDLTSPRVPDPAALAHLTVDGERWPVPVGADASLGDAIAGAAWWLAGLQEPLAEADRHGRPTFAGSLQARLGDAPGGPLRPPVDAYRRALAAALQRAGLDVPGRSWSGAPWAVALSHDLDAVRTRRLRAFAGSLRLGRPAEAVRRALGPDRRRASITALRALGQRHGTEATWFVKPGAWTPEDVPGGLDPALVERLRRWKAEGAEVGWHTGYGTLGRPDRLDSERTAFAGAFGAGPELARTHFLRWSPEMPGALAGRGVGVDSSLGWAETPGFRRGTAVPFRLFDTERGEATALWEMPLAVMDTTLADHLGLAGEALADRLAGVLDAAREVGGVAVVLWHNQVGGDTSGWQSRLDALDHALTQSRRRGAAVGPVGTMLERWIGGAG